MSNQTVRIISLWQPWASLCVWGEKEFETRHWKTSYRGILAIHAAKRFTCDEIALCHTNKFFNRAGHRNCVDVLNKLPLGAVVGSVILTKIWRTEWLQGGYPAPKLTEKEEAFGNYYAGRFAWQLEKSVALAEPIPLRGQQGMWTAPPEIEVAILSSRNLLVEAKS